MDLPNVRKLGRLRRTGIRFPTPPLHGGALVFDDVSEFGLNANNIIRFERVSSPVAA